jgi:protocatechuate 3,4-dioxygenase beta subunit
LRTRKKQEQQTNRSTRLKEHTMVKLISKLNRRQVLKSLGALAAATPIVGSLLSRENLAHADSGRAGAAGVRFGSEAVCTLYPQEIEGPFYLDLNRLRTDITEGKPGVPLQLNLRVLRAKDCTPIRDAVVDVWHSDALGWYSGYPSQGDSHDVDTTGQTFLRGVQVTDADGKVQFATIYPGWYAGRTTHIHVKVHLGSRTAVTSQMYFPDDVTDGVYAQDPYSQRGPKDTSNSADGFFDGAPVLFAVGPSGSGYAATMTISVSG